MNSNRVLNKLLIQLFKCMINHHQTIKNNCLNSLMLIKNWSKRTKTFWNKISRFKLSFKKRIKSRPNTWKLNSVFSVSMEPWMLLWNNWIQINKWAINQKDFFKRPFPLWAKRIYYALNWLAFNQNLVSSKPKHWKSG